jgi:hypothetical protein
MSENYMKNLIEYLKKNLKKGYTFDTLKVALKNQGYSKVAIEEAVRRATKEIAEKAPVLKEKPVIKYEIIDENDNPIQLRKSLWKRFFGM